MRNLRVLISLSATLALATQAATIAPSYAFVSKEKSKPSGTVLLPLTPKIDDGSGTESYAPIAPPVPVKPLPAPAAAVAASPAPSSSPDSKPVRSGSTAKKNSTRPGAAKSAQPATAQKSVPVNAPAADTVPVDPAIVGTPTQPNISAESGNEDIAGTEAAIDENSLLRGTVQIVADDTEYDQEKNTFLGTGNAVAIIAGEDSKLEADTILYDQNNGTIDARGNVKILRSGQLTTGSSFKFKVNSDEYLITNPDTELQGTTVVARVAKGDRSGLMFRDGKFTMPQPIHIQNNAYFGPLSSAERVAEEQAHPDAFIPQKPSFKFKARKMVYERYHSDGNLTVFGGKIQFEHFSVPIPTFKANVGAENTRVIFPVTPIIGNNLQVGGVNLGPQFNYAVGKTGAFSWAPVLQYGGRSIGSDGKVENNTGKLGAGFKLGYTNDRLSTHIAYGSVSNLLVADLKYRVTKNLKLQAGINRFSNDGMFGMRRPGRIAEFVDQRGIGTIPFISYLGFRTSAGWAQDNPGLIGLSGAQYQKLYGNTSHTSKSSAFKVQEQITANTHPIFNFGNSKYGMDMYLSGGIAARAYSTGDSSFVAQASPTFNVRANRLRARFGYTQSAVSGKSPFVYDQFIQGNRSVFLQGDVKIAKWLTLGTMIGYNLNSKLLYQRAITAGVGPDDFKLLFTRDTISGYQRFGFDILCGQPVPFNKLVVKGGADAGQLGGI